jgi:hypothetical protein
MERKHQIEDNDCLWWGKGNGVERDAQRASLRAVMFYISEAGWWFI